MFENTDACEQAVLVQIYFSRDKDAEDLNEFNSLVSSANIVALQTITGSRQAPSSKFFVGKGKAQEIADAVAETQASVILFNHTLTPAQARNLERLCQCRVIDRTGLILDIFAQRARTHEGKLQVELAQLRYLSTWLVRGRTDLTHQKGGIGLRGPGETQLESDRRLLRLRIAQLLAKLEKVEKQRLQGRQARIKAEIATVSLVGYTNAGKSTLFNCMTSADVYADDRLFATLDPTLRAIEVEDVGGVVLADTVGFIRDLPHALVAAFKATLQETRQATLLLHVVDVADPRRDENIIAVDEVLEAIDADDVPQLIVMNKIDRLDNDFCARIDRDADGVACRVWLSANTGQGIDLLYLALAERLASDMKVCQLHLPASAGRLRSRFYQQKSIIDEMTAEDGSIYLTIKLSSIEWHRLCKQEQDLLDYVV